MMRRGRAAKVAWTVSIKRSLGKLPVCHVCQVNLGRSVTWTATSVPSARRRRILVVPRSVHHVRKVHIKVRIAKQAASRAHLVNFRTCPVRPRVICVKKLRTLVAKQETGRALVVRQDGHQQKEVQNVKLARQDNIVVSLVESAKVALPASIAPKRTMLVNVMIVPLDGHRKWKVPNVKLVEQVDLVRIANHAH